MDTYEIKWVGHNNEDNHDKIWGWLIMKDRRIFCFWGRRGKKIRFKKHNSWYDAEKIQWQKEERNGYQHVPSHRYDELVKDFLDEVEIWCTTAIISDEVM